METGKKNVLPSESRDDQPLPGLPRVDLVRRAIPVRERARAWRPAPHPGGRAILVLFLLHSVLRAVRTEVHGRVLVGVKGLVRVTVAFERGFCVSVIKCSSLTYTYTFVYFFV